MAWGRGGKWQDKRFEGDNARWDYWRGSWPSTKGREPSGAALFLQYDAQTLSFGRKGQKGAKGMQGGKSAGRHGHAVWTLVGAAVSLKFGGRVPSLCQPGTQSGAESQTARAEEGPYIKQTTRPFSRRCPYLTGTLINL